MANGKTEGTLLYGIRLPANVMMPNGDSGFRVGQNMQTGFGLEGVVKEIRVVGANALITLESGKQALLFSSGMLGEVK